MEKESYEQPKPKANNAEINKAQRASRAESAVTSCSIHS
jgi:hypothetical protein